MNIIKKCNYLISKGYKYDSETGNVISHRNKVLTGKCSEGYYKINIKIQNKVYKIRSHQFAWYYIYNEVPNHIDHINHIKTDNRIINLRNVTNQQNSFNKLNIKGYSFNKKLNKFEAYININYKKIKLGYFDNSEDAHKAYLKAKEKYHVIQ